MFKTVGGKTHIFEKNQFNEFNQYKLKLLVRLTDLVLTRNEHVFGQELNWKHVYNKVIR